MNRTFLSSLPVISGNADEVTVISPLLKQRCQLTLIGDYHAAVDDERGRDFLSYSARMARCSRADIKDLEQIFAQAQNDGSDVIVLLGDILSFPSEKGVETLAAMMKGSAIPVYYIAGNHDWHYEGWLGSDMQQRCEWIARRLLPLYNGRDPLNAAVDINGIKLILVDNSVYQIKPSQLDFLRKELADGTPAIVACHVPFYLGMPFHSVVNYGFGHPDWGAASDPYFEIERRERWAESGLSAETFAFCREVLQAENVLGIVAGHSHIFRLENINQKFQLVVSSRNSTKLTLSSGSKAEI